MKAPNVAHVDQVSSWSTVNLDSDVCSDTHNSLSEIAAQNFWDVDAGRQAAGFESGLSTEIFARGSKHTKPEYNGRLREIQKARKSLKHFKEKGKQTEKSHWNIDSKSKSKNKRKKRKPKKSKKFGKERVKNFFQPQTNSQNFVEANWALLDVFVLCQLFLVFSFIVNAVLFEALQLEGVITCVSFAIMLGISALPPFFLIARGEVESAINTYATFQLTAGFFSFLLLVRYFLWFPWVLNVSSREHNILWLIVVWQFVTTLFVTWTPYKIVNLKILRLLSSQNGIDFVEPSRSNQSQISRSNKKLKVKLKSQKMVAKPMTLTTFTKDSTQAQIDTLRSSPLKMVNNVLSEPSTVSKIPQSSQIDALSSEVVSFKKPQTLQSVASTLAESSKSDANTSDMTVYRKKF